jgi:superoxide oxidase
MLHTTFLDDLQAERDVGLRYDAVSIAIHWATAALLAAMFWTAHGHEAAQDGEAAARMLAAHRSLGILVWALTVARLGWKARCGSAPPLPAAMRPMQRIAALSVQALLYALLLLMPLTGMLQSLLRGKSFPTLFGEVPAILARHKGAVAFFHDLHETGATVLLTLIGLHALAGLYHGLARRDGVLASMVPILGQKRR